MSLTTPQNGAKVYITSRSAEALQSTAKRLNELGPGTQRARRDDAGACVGLPSDLTSEEACGDFAKEISRRESALHILVNNSGTAWGESLETYPSKGVQAAWRDASQPGTSCSS